MYIPHKIVRHTTADAEPVVIGKKVSAETAEEESAEEENKLDEETLNNMLAEIAAKEQRAIEKVKEAEVQANIIKEQTKADCEKIVYDANEQVADILDQAQREGHEEGVKQGKIDGEVAIRKELKNIIDQANEKAQKTLQIAKEQTADYFIKAEDDIVAIVMMAIEKILPQHFLDVPQVVLPVVREAIKYVRDQKEIKVHVEPNSYELVLMARPEFQSMLTDGTAVLEVVSDDTLNPGDCVIETPNGGVDARLLTQIELMKNAIQSVLNK